MPMATSERQIFVGTTASKISFRGVFAEIASLANSILSQQVFIGGIVLTKLTKLCYRGAYLDKYAECIVMASELITIALELSMPHTLVAIKYATN